MLLTASGEELARPYSILIADDDRGNREGLSDVLSRRGFRTVTAADGKEAVEIVRVELIHLVLIDMHMPRLTGLEAVQILRQQINQLLPAILMTADATRELMRQAHQAQVYSVIPKPIDLRVALNTLAQALAQVYEQPPRNPDPTP